MKIERNQWECAFFGREIGTLLWQESNSAPACGGSTLRQQGVGGDNISTLLLNSPLRLVSLATSPASGGRISDFELLQAKLPTTAFTQIAELQQLGFQLVETEITFSLDLANFSDDLTACDIRFATENDLTQLKNIVSTAFLNSRFREPYFTQAENQRFYQQWIENAVKGEFDDLCLVAEKSAEIQGTISLRFLGEKAKIGLLAVSPEFQRQGIAKRLLFSAILQAKAQKAKSLDITTQLSNIPAIQLYQSFGAKITETNYWFYR